MSAAGSSIFTDADGYQASLWDMLDLLVMSPREFHARLTWVELPHVRLLRAEESASRVAHLRLPREQVFVFFAIREGASLLCGGEELRFGDLIWHSQDGRGHQRTTGASQWGSLAVTAETLGSFGRQVAGAPIKPPASPLIVRPAIADRRGLLRLHAQASRIAENSPNRIINPEVVRALDQDLTASLIDCLTTSNVLDIDPAREQQARWCVQFEEMLRAGPFRLLPTAEICATLGISEQRFRAGCLRLLGMGPGRYQRLRRLKLVRAALIRGGPEQRGVAEILARYGFADLSRFVAEYWQACGEMPPIPARGARRPRV